MAFLITSDVLIEPNIAMSELSESVNPAEAQQQLSAWRVADLIHPQAYLDVALGRADRIHPLELKEAQEAVPPHTLTEAPINATPRHWLNHRLVLTQIALIDRGGLRPAEKLHRLLDWSVDEAFVDGMAISFAVAFFGRSRPPKMMQATQSTSLLRCLDGIRNAAWDLTYLSYWSRYAREEESERIWILCSFDRLLRRLARVSIGPVSHDAAAAVRELFESNWSESDGAALLAHYNEVLWKVEPSPERGAVVTARIEAVRRLTSEVEDQLAATFV